MVSSTASATFSSPPAVCRGHFLGTSCPADVHHGTPAAVPINKRGQGPANAHQICAEATSACSPDTKVPGEMSFPVSHRHHQPQNHSLCMAQPLSPREHHYASLWDESLPTLQPPQPANNPPGSSQSLSPLLAWPIIFEPLVRPFVSLQGVFFAWRTTVSCVNSPLHQTFQTRLSTWCTRIRLRQGFFPSRLLSLLLFSYHSHHHPY